MKSKLCRYLIGLFAVAGVVLCLTSSQAEDQGQTPKKISSDDALSYTNHPSKVVVTGTVVEVFETDKAVHLNFGKPRPDQNFTVLVYAYKAASFPGLKDMKGKTIEATGTISTYEGKAIMYMSDPKDLKVVENKK